MSSVSPLSAHPAATPRAVPQDGGARLLQLAVRVWFVVLLVGQWLFVAHIAGFYVPTALIGNFAAWNKELTAGWIAGDALGNSVLAVHLAMALYLSFGGALQLIPQLRTVRPRLHRFNGRAYIAMAVVASLSALYLSLIRGHFPGGVLDRLPIQINGLLILLFAILAYTSARARRFVAHRRHAICLFLTVSGVWFFRTEVFSWVLLNGGPRGFDEDTFTGPVLILFGYLQFLLPLGVFWLYERARTGTSRLLKTSCAALLTVLTLLMGTGIVALGAYWL